MQAARSPAWAPAGAASSDFPLPSLQIYPDESHYFSSPSLRQHLYGSVIDFFVECFRIQDRGPAATGKEEED